MPHVECDSVLRLGFVLILSYECTD
eukprot:COSAG01_NODE_25297_length_749_cov_3.836923_1_plen_24_part_01